MSRPGNRPDRLRLLLGVYLYPHHSAGSGYGQLAPCLDARVLRHDQSPWGRAPEGSARWRVARKLFDARLAWGARRADVVHYLYVENHLRLALRAARLLAPRTVRVGTVHLPLDYYDIARSVAALAELNGIVTLTSTQEAEVRRHLPRARVRFVPHGCRFHHGHADPAALDAEPAFRAVVVGSNFRDGDALEAILLRIAETRPDWRVELVGAAAATAARFADAPRVTVHPRLDEAAYYALLNRGGALLLPLTFATANNALLEAHSVGLPAVCTDLPGTRDYAVSTTGLFRTPDEAVALLTSLAEEPAEERRKRRERTRREGERYDWARIAEELNAFYAELRGGGDEPGTG